MNQIKAESTRSPLCKQDLEPLLLFRSVDLDEILPMLKDCPLINLKPDEILIHPGTTNQHLYLLLSGTLRVHLHNNGEAAVATINKGENVGEISIIDKQPTSAYVIADQDCRVLQINDTQLWTIARQSHAVAYNLLDALAQRLRSGNSVIFKIQELLREYEYDATTDPLTGLYNRRWLSNALQRSLLRCKNNQQPLSLVMIDLDNFKHYNDTYGHVSGDRALRAVAQTLHQNMRPEDMICRYGGEEIIAILPSSGLEDAKVVAERLLHAVRGLTIIDSSQRPLPSVTISLGVAIMQPDDEAEDLIVAADQAMYRAKHAGRDRVSA